MSAEDTNTETVETEKEETKSLSLEVSVEKPSACERHVVVTISRDDIDRYFDDAFSEMMPEATIPGFRAGHAPRKLVEKRFRPEVSDQIKGSLLVDSLEQIAEENDFTAISEPDFDLEAVDLPEEGPMTFEFDIEVRPEFEVPNWEGLEVTRPIADFSDEDINDQLEMTLARYGKLVPHDGPASAGDYITTHLSCKYDGKQISSAKELVIRIRPNVSFRDANLADFDKLMDGVKAGDTKTVEVTISESSDNEELRGKTVELTFDIQEIKKLQLPELDEDFLDEMGGFETEEELRNAIRKDLERQVEYESRRKIRQQISAMLTASADWELPPSMLKRQSARELERAVMELRRSGFGEADIRARENELRQNSTVVTENALKEHFVLESIAESQDIDVEENEYEAEISLIALQSGESTRRIRAQLEKRGMMDVLRNQILENKVLALVESKAKFIDEPFELPKQTTEAVDLALAGEEMTTEVVPTADATDSEEDNSTEE